jgi:hypothetical protein
VVYRTSVAYPAEAFYKIVIDRFSEKVLPTWVMRYSDDMEEQPCESEIEACAVINQIGRRADADQVLAKLQRPLNEHVGRVLTIAMSPVLGILFQQHYRTAMGQQPSRRWDEYLVDELGIPHGDILTLSNVVHHKVVAIETKILKGSVAEHLRSHSDDSTIHWWSVSAMRRLVFDKIRTDPPTDDSQLAVCLKEFAKHQNSRPYRHTPIEPCQLWCYLTETGSTLAVEHDLREPLAVEENVKAAVGTFVLDDAWAVTKESAAEIILVLLSRQESGCVDLYLFKPTRKQLSICNLDAADPPVQQAPLIIPEDLQSLTLPENDWVQLSREQNLALVAAWNVFLLCHNVIPPFPRCPGLPYTKNLWDGTMSLSKWKESIVHLAPVYTLPQYIAHATAKMVNAARPPRP